MIARPVRLATDAMKALVNGNLAIDDIRIKNKDEVGEMAESLNRMKENLRMLVSNVNESALSLAGQSEQLSAAAQQNTAASQKVAESSRNNMQESESQLRSVSTMTGSISDIASGIQEVAGQIQHIHKSMAETTAIMVNLEKQSADIQTITTLITSIADQTNLLALNAAIEAARAGENGKGFAVVADEVRKLAEQSKSSAADIEQTVRQIQRDTAAAALSIKEGSGEINRGLLTSETSLDAFAQIEQAVSKVVSNLQTVSAAVEEIQAMAIEAADTAGFVKTSAEETVSSAQNSNAATEQQLAAREQILSSALSLSHMAESLQIEMNKFTLA
ncbi:hypothetical protein BTO30_09510 [Domibacillus antri]|uniref:Methyl-accepting chemotaxis protein n=1 Tax=Domibacillus antri TaxID=1714264 RepID=A0A1Q8Q5H7_9BACI|nr:HAMP domain-containing methyl-accepting chemotaxis protein [Domibacillus antri]OLN22531.1 hypothetical protein BTO30_09510 [Domibacillus antri]